MDRYEAFMKMRHAGWQLVNQTQSFNGKMRDLTRTINGFRRACKTEKIKRVLKRGFIDDLIWPWRLS